MATYDLEEQEQIDELRTWWRMHGAKVSAAVMVAAFLAIGWQGWNYWQRSRSAEASRVYSAMMAAVEQKDVRQVKALSGSLISDFAGTEYAGLGALISARLLIEIGDEKSASAQLDWASQSARSKELRALASLRMGAGSSANLLDTGTFSVKTESVNPVSRARAGEATANAALARGDAKSAEKELAAALRILETSESDKSPSLLSAYRQVLVSRLDDVQAISTSSGNDK